MNRTWLLSFFGACVAILGTPAKAGKVTPQDFYCRSLGAGSQRGAEHALFGQSMSWSTELKIALDQNPALKKELAEHIQAAFGEPKFYKAGGGSCVSGSSRAAGVCQQNVECSVISPELKTKVVDTYAKLNGGPKVGYDKIDAETKGIYLSRLASRGQLQWLPSSVTCATTQAGMCPDPDLCKSDVEHDGVQANTDPTGAVKPLGTALPPDGDANAGGAR